MTKKSKAKGQNTHREFGNSKDSLQLCSTRVNCDEFSPDSCTFGASCKFEHDIRKYLKEGRRDDLDTFDGRCPVWESLGRCSSGWRCRFVRSHSVERPTSRGPELSLLRSQSYAQTDEANTAQITNNVGLDVKVKLRKKQFPTPKTDQYSKWLASMTSSAEEPQEIAEGESVEHGNPETALKEQRAQYVEAPFWPSEKRRLYYGPETPILAPLTTQGNLPFRRLCVELGAQVTWSEMAMGFPLLQGEKGEWALMRAHESELQPPKCENQSTSAASYSNHRDLKFGAQIAGNKPALVMKTTEVLAATCPHLRAIDLNCGCPIDLVYRQGAGSALLESPAKLEKILRGMNAVSGEIPITVKIRMGTKDDKPTAKKLVERFAVGGVDSKRMDLGATGIQAITLHGRSRQQRYTKSANWAYIAECSAVIKRYNEENASRLDTIQEPDSKACSPDRIFFIGNGDCYSYVDYYDHIREAKVDAVMAARGALIKPWLFEEIEKGQHLDKSATERLQYIEKFVRYGLETWGSDEVGIGTTRRFLLEWLSFTCRYVPLGLLEYVPPKINERPPAYRGRNELETLLSSDNYKDWIKISEMFLGPAHPNFKFEPKHKSNSYEAVEG